MKPKHFFNNTMQSQFNYHTLPVTPFKYPAAPPPPLPMVYTKKVQGTLKAIL